MFWTFLKIARRHLWQSRLYACINILGLTIGSTCVLFALLFLLDENSFDSFHTNNPNLFRITTTINKDGEIATSGGTGQVQGPAFKSQVPEIVEFVRIMGGDIYGDLRSGSKALKLQLLFVDDSFFDVFSFKLKSGASKTVLSNVNSVVITEKTAMKLFNRLDVIGEPLEMDADPSAQRIGKPLVVSGVVENPPANSSIQFDILFPFRFMQVSFDDKSWLNAYLGTFVVLHPQADIGVVSQKFNKIHRLNAREQLAESMRMEGSVPQVSYGLQPITDIHLNPQEISNQNREGGIINGSRPIYSYLFLGIAIFILLMATVNFVNINLASSLKRAKEIGVRKVTGGTQSQILVQFLIESGILCFIAYVLAALMTIFLLPIFNEISGKHITLASLSGFWLVIFTLAIPFVNILLSGAYPAFLLSRYNPVEVLYKKQKLLGRNRIGNSLVIFQFAIAVVLGICTLVLYQQMRFIKTKDLGYNPDQIISVKIPGLADTKHIGVSFKDQLRGQSNIEKISVSGEFGIRDTKVNGKLIKSYYRSIDADYIPTMGIRIKEGRNFSASFQSDQQFAVMVNEAFVKAAGWKNPVGMQLKADSYFGDQMFTVIGVVKNFHIGSFREHIQPIVMVMTEQYGGDVVLAKGNIVDQTRTIELLREVFHKLLPGAVFEASFLSEQNARIYEQETRWQKIIGLATALSISICLIGLFALEHLATTQKMKETGIRVVLGATVLDIVWLFSSQFLRMVGIAVLLACPIAYYLMNIWLADFAYRITFQWWFLAIPGAFAILISLATVSIQAIKAAHINPVRSIYTE